MFRSTSDRLGGAGTVRLFELPFSAVDSCQLAYRVELRTEDVEGVYLQMWCRSGGASAPIS